MILAPVAWNLLSSGTALTAAAAFEKGWPATNLWDADPRKPCRFRNAFTNASDQHCNFNDGAARTATLAAGTRNSHAEMAIAVAAAFNAVSSNWRAYLIQDPGSATRHRWVVLRTAGTASLQILTGANTATNFLREMLGFRNEDRSAAGTHTGDFAAVQGTRDVCLVDLGAGTSATAHGSILCGLDVSPAACLSVSVGSSTAVSDATYIAGDAADDEAALIPYDVAAGARYVRLEVSDFRREDALRAGIGYWYHGPWLDTDAVDPLLDRQEWEVSSFARRPQLRAEPQRRITGHWRPVEKEPREEIDLGFGNRPGLGTLAPEVESVLAALGREEKVLVCWDKTREPHRNTRLCRLRETPTITKRPADGPRGRWSVSLKLETVPVRVGA